MLDVYTHTHTHTHTQQSILFWIKTEANNYPLISGVYGDFVCYKSFPHFPQSQERIIKEEHISVL
jgi:hypothetical protein